MFELSVELVGDVALDEAASFSSGLALADASLDVGLGRWVAAFAGDRDGVQGLVEGAVAVTVKSVTLVGAAARVEGADAGQSGESARFVPVLGGPADEDLGCGQRTDADLVEEVRSEVGDEVSDLVVRIVDLHGERGDAAGKPAQADQPRPVFH